MIKIQKLLLILFLIRILITGNTGQLGKSLIDIKPDNCEIITPNKNDLDLSNSKQCRNIINEIKPDWLINCAAFTNVDAAENKKDLTMKINASAPNIFAKSKFGFPKYASGS